MARCGSELSTAESPGLHRIARLRSVRETIDGRWTIPDQCAKPYLPGIRTREDILGGLGKFIFITLAYNVACFLSTPQTAPKLPRYIQHFPRASLSLSG